MRASEIIDALQRIMAQQGDDPICCRETSFLGPKPIVSVLVEPHMPGPTGALLPAKVEPSQSFVVIW